MTQRTPSAQIPDAAAAFRDRPWRKVPKDAFGPADNVPTMLAPMERKLYLWLGEHWAKGHGAIIDLGSFVGGSTACLARGRQFAGRDQPIFAFDRFRASDPVKNSLLYPAGIPEFDGTDILALSQELLAPFTPPIQFRKGEIETQDWTDGPIEILCIDAAKTASSADRIAEIFFPHLIPGRSVVVQQDFLHWKVPWVPAQMEWLSAYFTPVAVCPRDTVVYLCTEVPSVDDLAVGRVQRRRDHALKSALLGASARLAPWAVEDRIQMQVQAIALNPGMRRAKDFRIRP